MADIIRNDNTGAFGQTLLKIELNDPTDFLAGHEIKKAEVRIGNVVVSIDNPIFPLSVNLNELQTGGLPSLSDIYLAVWDEMGRKKTCMGQGQVTTESRKV